MNTLKRISSFLLVFILVLASSYADNHNASNTLHVVASVPENYGVAFPDNALRFGNFVFEIRFDLKLDPEFEIGNRESRTLIRTDELSIGEMQPGLGNFNFTLVYYGNQSQPYRTDIFVEPNLVWIFEDDDSITVPIEVELVQNEDCESDIICQSYRDGQAYIEIPPAGPREDVPVLDVNVKWDGGKDLRPGNYSTELKLYLRVV